MVAAPRDSGFEVWDAATGAPVAGRDWDAKGLKDAHALRVAAASPDGRLIALFHGQRRVVFYDVAKRAVVRELDDPRRTSDERFVGHWAVPTNFAFTPDGTGFVWGSPTVQRWDVATGKPTWPVTWDQGHTDAVTRLLYTPDGSILVSAARDGVFYLWDVKTGRPRHRLPKGVGDLAALTPEGRTLVALTAADEWVDRKRALTEWDLGTGKVVRIYGAEGECPQYGSSNSREVTVTADGARIVTLTDNYYTLHPRLTPGRYLTVWDRASGKLVREVNMGDRIGAVALAPDGRSYAEFTIRAPHVGARIVSVDTGREIALVADADVPLERGSAVEGRFVYSPDARMLATRLESPPWTEKPLSDRPVQVWDPATGRELARFPAAGPVRFAFAPDGRSLVVAGADGLRAYELATRREAVAVTTARPSGKRGGPIAETIAVGPGGRTAATGHADGTILVWDLAPRTTGDADAAWAALADPDASAGWAAVWRLAAEPDRAVRLIGENLKPAAADPKAADLVRRLDAADFRTREEADRRLRALGSKAEPDLRAALNGKPSAELRDRVEKLLAALDPTQPLIGDDLRDVRAVQVLEAVGTAAARRLLRTLAAGDPHTRLAREARAALDRR